MPCASCNRLDEVTLITNAMGCPTIPPSSSPAPTDSRSPTATPTNNPSANPTGSRENLFEIDLGCVANERGRGFFPTMRAIL